MHVLICLLMLELLFRLSSKLLLALPLDRRRLAIYTKIGGFLVPHSSRGAFYTINQRLTPRQRAVPPCCWYTLDNLFE